MNKTEFWFAVKVTASPLASEAIEFAFNCLDSLGTEINNLREGSREDVCVVGYFDRRIETETVKSELRNSFKIYDLPINEIRSIDSNEVENQDWLAEWKKHWKPTETGRFIITPPWENVEPGDKHIISIEPNMAFGTGTHETTKLCLKAIGNYYSPGMSFLDVGTGTGILAIAAAKISANEPVEIIACDTDPDSVKIARENAALNDADGIQIFEGPITSETPSCEFVCANMTADVIIPILPLLFERSKRFLVLSGILVEQEAEVLDAVKKYESAVPTVEVDGEWISVIIEKSGKSLD